MEDQKNREQQQLARSVVRCMTRKGVKLLALDFDMTILSIHTGGTWKGAIARLAQLVRPCYRALIEAVLENNSGLHVCVVTYSSQLGVIEELFKFILPNSDTSRILIQTNEPTKGSQQASRGSDQAKDLHKKHGKEEHISKVLTNLYNKHRVVIQANEVLLMDDDANNVKIARSFGHSAYEVKPDVRLENINEFVENMPAIPRQNSNVSVPTAANASVPPSSSTRSPTYEAATNRPIPMQMPAEQNCYPVGYPSASSVPAYQANPANVSAYITTRPVAYYPPPQDVNRTQQPQQARSVGNQVVNSRQNLPPMYVAVPTTHVYYSSNNGRY